MASLRKTEDLQNFVIRNSAKCAFLHYIRKYELLSHFLISFVIARRAYARLFCAKKEGGNKFPPFVIQITVAPPTSLMGSYLRAFQ